jgi:magnesium transporter
MPEPTATITRADAAPAVPLRDPDLAPSFVRAADGTVRRDLKPGELVRALAMPGGQIWVDVDSTEPCQHALLEKVFGFHHLAIEDTLNPKSRVKVEEYEGKYLFAVIRSVRFCEETEDDPYDIDTINLCLFVGPNFVVTVHAGTSPTIDKAAHILERNPDVLERGIGRLAHLFMDIAIDEYFPILDQVDDFIEKLESRVVEEFDQSVLQDIFKVRRLVLALRRDLMPQREIFNALANRPGKFVASEAQVYFRDVYDHVFRINESLENYRELLGSTMDTYHTQVSNRLSTATKRLSAVATISIPFVVISGMYGMNFERIPLATHPQGFWLMLALQLVVGIVLYVWLRWRNIV